MELKKINNSQFSQIKICIKFIVLFTSLYWNKAILLICFYVIDGLIT